MAMMVGRYLNGSVLSNILNKELLKVHHSLKSHIIRVTDHAFDDFAATGKNQKFNRRVLGL
jgi:hypothetical protein